MRAVLGMYEKVTKLSRSVPEDHHVAAINIDEPGWLADFVVTDLELSIEQRQDILETADAIDRLHKASVFLAKELDVLELQNKIHSQVQQEVDKNQREYFLREQMRAIQKELGEADTQTRDLATLREKLATAGLPEEARTKADEELDRLAAMPAMSPEVGMVRSYLEWLANLPWTLATEDQLDLKHAANVLEENHYGLPKVKERILEYLAVRKLASGKQRSPVICFVGPPGVGKTSLGRSIAQAIGRNFVRISLGGIRDEAEIRGHRRTYIGALPGRSFRPCGKPPRSIRSSCSTRSTRSAPTSGATRLPRCSRCSTRSRTTPFPITTSTCPTTCPESCSSRLPTTSTRFHRPFGTGWKSLSCPVTSRRRSSRSPGGSGRRSKSKRTA